jgi:hypothetical protein
MSDVRYDSRARGHLRPRMRIEVGGRTDNCGPVIRRRAHRDRVFLNVFGKVDAPVEALGDNVPAAVICDEVKNDVRVLRMSTGGERGTRFHEKFYIKMLAS